MKKVILVLLSCVFGFSLSALTETINGVEWTYSVANWEATITGCDKSISGAISIPTTIDVYPVTAIGNMAFYECGLLESVEIPDSVTTIGSEAFRYCSNLSSVRLPSQLTKISARLFYHCTKLTSITLPTSLTVIEMYALENTGLREVVIPEGVVTLEHDVFLWCDQLEKVILPATLQEVGFNAFYGCDALQSIIFCGGPLASFNIGLGINGTGYYLNAYAAPWQAVIDSDGTWQGLRMQVLEGNTKATITFDANGGVGGTSVTLDCGSVLSAPTVTREGYTFVGWTPNVPVTVPITNTTYVAQWRANSTSASAYLVIDLSGGTSATSYPVTTLEAPPEGGWTDEYKTTKLVLRVIEAGSFKMNGSYDVTISKPFYMGVFEVTQKQYQLVTGSNPSFYKGDARPVEYISWNTIRGISSTYNWPSNQTVDANSFVGKLRAKTGLDLDLPTEAQWEYACRAGTTSKYNNGGNAEADLKKLGRYCDNWRDGRGGYTQHTKVGSYLPNAWGLYDMHGNVWEWCLDWYGSLASSTDPVGPSSGWNRVYRGGGWITSASVDSCTSSYRNNYYPSCEDNSYGFRLACPVSSGISSLVAVTFDANGGVGGASVTLDYGSALSAPTVTREGYTLVGWLPSLPVTVPWTDTTYVAQWQINQYTQTFDANGGVGGTSVTLDCGFVLSAPTVTRKGYTFVGWSPEVPKRVPATNVTYVAQWQEMTNVDYLTYKIENNQVTITGCSQDVTGAFTLPAMIEGYPVVEIGENAFYECTGLTSIIIPKGVISIGVNAFSRCANLESVSIPDSLTFLGDSVLFGCEKLPMDENGIRYESDARKILVSVPQTLSGVFTVPSTVRFIHNAAINGTALTSIIFPEGVTFIGWDSLRANHSLTTIQLPSTLTYIGDHAFSSCPLTTITFAGPPPTVDGYIYARTNTIGCYSAKYATEWQAVIESDGTWQGLKMQLFDGVTQSIITFDANGGEGGTSVTLDHGSALSAPTVTREGYTFVGWLPSLPTTAPSTDTTYVAQWQINQYTQTFHANGGVGGTSVTLDYGLALSAPTVTREGYKFVGWTPNVPATIPAIDTTYVAQWQANVYTILYSANGGSGTMEATAATYDVPVTIVNNAFVRDGYRFIGWATTADGEVLYTSGESVSNLTAVQYGVVTLYAIWEEIPKTPEGPGGDEPSTPTSPNWSVGNYQYNMVVYASIQNAQGVSLEADGNLLAAFDVNGICRGVVGPLDIGIGVKVYQLTVCSDNSTESGLTLKLWDVATNTIYDVNGTINFAADTEVGLLWDPIVYTVTETTVKYDVITMVVGEGIVMGAGSYELGEAVTLTATPDEGYVFCGWSTTPITSTATYTFTMPEASVNVTAYFAPLVALNNYVVDQDFVAEDAVNTKIQEYVEENNLKTPEEVEAAIDAHVAENGLLTSVEANQQTQDYIAKNNLMSKEEVKQELLDGDEVFTKDEMKALALGAPVIQVKNGKATVSIQVQRASELDGEWEVVENGEVKVEVSPKAGEKAGFYKFVVPTEQDGE